MRETISVRMVWAGVTIGLGEGLLDDLLRSEHGAAMPLL